MTPAFQMYGVRGYLGDNRLILPQLPTGSVHCVVTSPPYWGQRDYGTMKWEGGDENCDHADARIKGRYDYALTDASMMQKGRSNNKGADGGYWKRDCPKCGARRVDSQIGLEENPDQYVRELVMLFREVRRVMRDDGTLWLNLGDKFASNPAKGRSGAGKNADYLGGIDETSQTRGSCNLPEKNLMGIPWRVALAMQADGWVLRADIIWHKPNAMPGSQRDRPSINHEYMFLFAKGSDYYYDDMAIREPAVCDRVRGPALHPCPDTNGNGGLSRRLLGDDRTKRSVWSVPVASEKEGHFASYPPKLILPCILAGTSEHGVCAACGSQYRRVTNRDRVATRPGTDTKVTGVAIIDGNRDPQRHVTRVTTLGWEKTCVCETNEAKPAIVLDPFGGTGTTAAVAIRKKRRAILIELNPDYVEIQKRKLAKAANQRGFGL